MTHTLAAVFDNRADADRAKAALSSSGFSNAQVQLSDDTWSGITANAPAAAAADDSIGSGIKRFFSNLFSDDDDDERRVYTEAVNRGNAVLTVQADSEQEVERAADIVERYGPIDIDEQQDDWRASGWEAGAQRAAGASLQGGAAAQAASQQSGQPGSLQGGSLQGGSLQGGSQQYASGTASETIPVVQEELRVGKRAVQRGGVRIYQRVVSTPVNETVNLREEHVTIERHAVDQPVDPRTIEAFQEQTFEWRETAEEAVVQKTARVVEEVVVGKEVTERQDQISDTVRHTEVQVEQLAGSATDDDSYYRGHWSSNYASAGTGAYEDYEPAYRYGRTLRANYPGRAWDDAEPELRSSWESSHPGSPWERFKAAVRHGWDRITS